MRRMICLVAAVAVLAGCATPTMPEMREKGPAAVYTTKKSESEAAKCVLFAWQDMRLAGEMNTASIQPGREGGSTVTAHGNEYFVDVRPMGAGAEVRYFHVGDSWISQRLNPAVKACM